ARGAAAMPPGIDVRICPLATPEDSPPAIIGPSDGPPTVMLLGRVDELFAKGHDILIDVWPNVVSAIPDARLLFVGGGSAMGTLRDLVATSSVRASIEIRGFVPDERLTDYWRRAAAVAMPGFAAGFGIVHATSVTHGR